ncbi:flagellar filament capping protein FliD [Citrobacter amalonaticus]|jgi:flagellar hook-associated protein 2|uniref:flagellar filament capping protein FliD n=1 Tax=Citrobacter amalonaticus TaxID=35703 RepID=UPI00076AEF7B|nr:flagellar filament capping protein FliD [Citrobacter amalonaticus]AMG53912.1 flagellar filament capping protein FliD [Citrobacter amalonaticus]MBC6533436.1 flagellar filament capping protein FliD [Citrobacter amalonaticus]MCX3393390.1 flagellar filament capping protein FliD [Citrobacter amalonaticus]MDQ2172173.1 flagellar filament capping protein FliD [Citrobacter amalonaticus]MDR1846018.1 flagellar filament capping protein FliD [Citrobacter amalonaticus]
MASFTSLGVGSNLPLDTLLTNLTTAEKGRLKPITQQQSSFTARLTAFGTLKSSLEKFQTANTALNDATLFKSTTAVSNSTDLTVSTTAGAAAGIYKINVTQLAQAQSIRTTSTVTDSKAAQGNDNAQRTLIIKQDGKEKPLEIKLTKDQTSLEGMRDAINNANGGVSASIVKLKDNDYQLVLTSSETGLANKMSISVKGDDKLNQFISFNNPDVIGNNVEQIVEAKNAELNVNGIDIVRSSNTITDAPQGVTLVLSKEVKDVTVTVSKSNDKSTTAIKAWVDAYNSLVDTIGSLTKYTSVDAGAEEQDASNGALLGDSTVRTIQTGIRGQFSSSANDGKFQTLSQMGITQDGTTGKLKIDDEKLKKALTDNSVDVQQLLVGDGKETGITTKVASLVKGYLADDGIIDSAQDSINATLKKLTKQYLSVSASIDDTIARYKAQFTQLDTMMSKLNNTSSYLNQQFTAMTSS